MEQRSFAVY